MLNKVFVNGEVVNVKDEGGIWLVQAKVVEPYGNGNKRENTIDILSTEGKQIKDYFDLAQEKKKKLFVSVVGVLASRKFNKEDKYRDHTYVLSERIGVVGSTALSPFAQVIFEGEIVKAESRFTANGKEFFRLYLRNVRTRGDREFSVYVNADVYGQTEFPFREGDFVILEGRLESYESKKAAGKYVTNIIAFDVYPAGVVKEKLPTEKPRTKADAAGINDDEEVDTIPSEDELPF